MAAREFWDKPMLCLRLTPSTEVKSAVVRQTSDANLMENGMQFRELEVRGAKAWALADRIHDGEVAEHVLHQCAPFDLGEPFQRLRDAIDEAHRSQAA
jgi:hypothetical protein